MFNTEIETQTKGAIMKIKYKIIPATLFLLLSGCSLNSESVSLDDKVVQEVKFEIETISETVTESDVLSETTTELNVSDEVKSTEESKPDEAEAMSSDISMENGETEMNTDMGKYKGEKYTFYKAGLDDYHAQLEYALLHKIRSVYSEHHESEYHGLFLGQVVTLFGAENLTENNEDLISHAVAAENENGDIIYLEVYYGPSGPAIGGQDGENFEEAAKELEDIIRNTVPVDFECSSVYEDVGVSIRMGTKNGKGFYEADFGEMDFDEMDFDEGF